MNELLFELIRIALGKADRLPFTLSSEEWTDLFKLAQNQSIVGICFIGLQKLGANTESGYVKLGLSEIQYLVWLGAASQCQQRNECLDSQCLDLQEKFRVSGYRSSILKGQGIASFYTEDLREFRQSGDIDIFVDCGRKKTISFLRSLGKTVQEWDYVHAQSMFFPDTLVEVHYRVSVMHNLCANHRIQKFFARENKELFGGLAQLRNGSLIVPSNWMNIFYLLQHSYRHLFTEGVSLKQLMDIYFALSVLTLKSEEKILLKKNISSFGMSRFVSGIIWVLVHIFAFDLRHSLWSPNENEGLFLLNQIMQDRNLTQSSKNQLMTPIKVAKFSSSAIRSFRHVAHYTGESLSVPLYYVWHLVWKRITLLIDKKS